MIPIDATDPISRSADLIAGNLARLREIFPEAFTEGAAGGAIDFDVLKQLLGGAVDEREEKYGLNWHGKRQARQFALTPSTATLRPCPEESVDWDTTQNLMIEGDNLEVLKLLQKSYAGKIRLIYIDPPYNTGNDFIYPDDYRDSIRSYLELTGQVQGGRKMTSNTEANGRFHTDWLNMMYPRLKAARSLLTDDGLLFISIDDNEADSLRKICSEVFGEENFVAQFVWNTEGHTDNQFDVKVNHEYILLFAKNANRASLGHVIDPNTRQESNLWKGFAENSITKNGPANPPSLVLLPAGFPCSEDYLDLPANAPDDSFFATAQGQGYIDRRMTDRYAVTYPIRLDRMWVENGKLKQPCRVYSGWANVNKLRAFIANYCLPIDDEGDSLMFYLSDRGVLYYRRIRERARNILSVLRNMGTTERMRAELEEMGLPFQYPKPKELLHYLVRIGCEKSGIVLDFFAGSGTLAHAVWLQALEDQVGRRVIMVQLPEPLDPSNEKHLQAIQFCQSLGRPQYLTEITKERLRRTAHRIRSESPLADYDLGFRVFKLDSSNIRAWEPDRNDVAATLDQYTEHLKADRTQQDILYELLLKLGLDLCIPIETREIAGKAVHSIGAGVLLVCLAPSIPNGDVEALALGIVAWRDELQPAGETVVVFRDGAFDGNVAKTNLTAILQQHGLANVRSL